MDNKLVHFMDLIVFHLSGMKSSTLRTLLNSSTLLVHFTDLIVFHLSGMNSSTLRTLLNSSTLWTISSFTLWT